MLKVSYLFIFSALFSVVSSFSSSHAWGGSCSTMDLVREEKWDAAIRCSESQNDKLLTKLVLWSKYRNKNSDAQTEEILDFIPKNPHFPNLVTLQAIAERKINNHDRKAN